MLIVDFLDFLSDLFTTPVDILTGGRTALNHTTRQIERFSSCYRYSAVKRLLIFKPGMVYICLYILKIQLST